MAIKSDVNIQRVADYIAANPGKRRGEIAAGLGIAESDSTVYRWIQGAIEKELICRTGGKTSAAAYYPTDRLRLKHIGNHLRQRPEKRPRIGYNERWLLDYVPNETFLLSSKSRDLLMARCEPGAAPISSFTKSEMTVFLTDLSFASSRLEKDSIEYAATQRLLDHGRDEGLSRDEMQIILNHKDAAEFIISSIKTDGEFPLTTMNLRVIHSLLSYQLLRKEWLGTYRKSPVVISASSYIPPEVPAQIEHFAQQIITKASQIKNPYEQSFFLLVHLPYLQPFEDANKRTSRVVCNIPLLNNGLPPISWMGATYRVGMEGDYKDAVITAYELNEPLLLENLFVDNFMNSSERYAVLKREHMPNPIASTYHGELKTWVSTYIRDGVDRVPPSVAPADVESFLETCYEEIQGIRNNHLLGVRYGFSPSAISLWVEREDRNSEGRDDGPDSERQSPRG